MKRKKLEFSITVIIHLMTAIVSALLAIAVLSAYRKLTPEFLIMGSRAWAPALFPVLIAECLTMFITMYDGRYAFRRAGLFSHAVRCLVSTLVVAGVWAVILLIQKNEITHSRYFFVTTVIFHFVLLTLAHFFVQNYIINTYYKTHGASLVMVVSDRAHAADGSKYIKKDWSRKICSIALLDETVCPKNNGFAADKVSRNSDTKENVSAAAGESKSDGATLTAAFAESSTLNKENESGGASGDKAEGAAQSVQYEEIDHVPVVAGREDLIAWVRQNAVDEVFFFIEDETDETVARAVQAFVKMGISVHISLDSVSRLNRTVEEAAPDYYPHIVKDVSEFVDRVPMASYDPPQPKLRYLCIKRCMDIAGGIVGSLMAAVLYVILGIIIKLDSPGPVLFAQERVGRNGRLFKIYKFRSMYTDAEERKAALMKENEMSGLMFKIKDDPRITPVGRFIRKTSLDEFPQFFNVLRGDMSLVGTRPPTVSEFKQYSDYHKRRLAMKPGITGMWQVSGRSEITDFEDVVKLDCSYIDNWSLGLDIKILFKTVLIVCTGRGSE